MRPIVLALVGCLALITSAPLAASAAISLPYSSLGRQQVAPGVFHDWGTASAHARPQKVHVVDVDPATSGIRLETSLPGDMVNARETTSSQALRQSREGHRVVAATNGSTFNSWPGGVLASRGLNVRNGELLTVGVSPAPPNPILALAIDHSGHARIGTPTIAMSVTLPDATTVRIDRVNQGRATDEVILYTPRFGTGTGTDATGLEIVLGGAALPITPNGTWAATVVDVRPNAGDTPMASGQLVLSAAGAAVAPLENLQAGDPVTLSISLENGWKDVETAIGGRELLVRDGQTEIVPYRDPEVRDPNPRTLLGVTASGHLLMVTVDGRQSESGGLRLDEAAELMISLGAVDALNLDGGGSTTMLVRNPGDVQPSIANGPSELYERAINMTLQVISTIPRGAPSEIYVDAQQEQLATGASLQMRLRARDAAYNGVGLALNDAQWTSSNQATVAVSPAGLATGVGAGMATVSARVGGVEGGATLRVVNARDMPVVAPPQVSIAVGKTAPTNGMLVDVSWSATSNTNTIAGIDLQLRGDLGGWHALQLPKPAASGLLQELPFGHTFTFRLRATDARGDTSPWVEGQTFLLEVYDGGDPALEYAGAWASTTYPRAIGRALDRSRQAGNTLALSYSGAQVAWIGAKGPAHGRAKVSVANASGSVIQTRRVRLLASSMRQRQVLFVSLRTADFRAVQGRITVRALGALSVDVDAFVVLRPGTPPAP